MDRTRLPEDIQALNARLTANPELTENMGPVHVLTVAGRKTGRLQATPVSPVNQLNGRYSVRDANLQRLHAAARELLQRFDHWHAEFVPRSQNAEAHRLAHKAIHMQQARDAAVAS